MSSWSEQRGRVSTATLLGHSVAVSTACLLALAAEPCIIQRTCEADVPEPGKVELVLHVTQEGKIALNRLPELLSGSRSGSTSTSPPIKRFILDTTVYEIGADGQVHWRPLPPMKSPDSSTPSCSGGMGAKAMLGGGGRILIKNLLRGPDEYVYYDVNGDVLCTIWGVSGKSKAWICPDGEHLLITPGNGDPSWVQDSKGTVLLGLQHHVFDALFWNDRLITYQCLSDEFPEPILIRGAPSTSIHKQTAIVGYGPDWSELWRREYSGYWFQPMNVRFNTATGQTYVRLRPFSELEDPDAAESPTLRDIITEQVRLREAEGAVEPRPGRLVILEPDGAVHVNREIGDVREYYLASSGDFYYEKSGMEIRMISALEGDVKWSWMLNPNEVVTDVGGSKDGTHTALLLFTSELREDNSGIKAVEWELVVFHKEHGVVFRQDYGQASMGISMSFTGGGDYVVVKESALGIYIYSLVERDH